MTSRNPPIGIGYYSIPEAAMLLQMPAINIHRWLRGYTYRKGGKLHPMPPLWKSQIGGDDVKDFLLGFRDLIELRFVNAFKQAGLSLITIRGCLNYAQDLVAASHPFSTQQFKTDGKTIFLESAKLNPHDPQLLDLRKRQYVIAKIIEQSFKDLDIEHDAVARWRPYRGKASIVIDPERSFGQPVTSKTGIPTVVIFEALEAEKTVAAVSRLFEIDRSAVRDAVAYEQQLQKAA